MFLDKYVEHLRKLAKEVETGDKSLNDNHLRLRQLRVATSIRKWAEEVESKEENSDSTETG